MTGRTASWTIAEASAEFERTGIPVEPDRLRMIIRALRWQPCGETASGERGGRGQSLYRISDLQRLHSALSPWLAVQGPLAGREPDSAGMP